VIAATEEIVRIRDSFNNPNPPPIFSGTMATIDPSNIPDPPYLPEIKDGYRYTLVLDLDETLVHYFMINESQGTFAVRPGCDTFLTEMSRYFEIVIFTAALAEYANWVINEIDL